MLLMIFLFIIFLQYHNLNISMHDKSSEANSPTSAPMHQANRPLDSNYELRPLSALRLAFSQWIRSLPMEERFLAVKIQVPQVVQTMKHIFLRTEGTGQDRSHDERTENGVEGKRFSRKSQKNFYDSLVFVSDGHDFLDHICFDFALLECPERLFDLLLPANDQTSSRPLAELLKLRRDSLALNQKLQKGSREQVSYELFSYLRQEVFANFSQNSKCSEAITRSLEQEKKRKKEFSSHWKFLSEEAREKILLLGHADANALREMLNERDVAVKALELELEMEELLKLEKNEFCNRIFKCKLKKLLAPISGYYELVYQQWKKEVEKTRKKRVVKHNRSDRDYNSQQKSEYKEAGKQQYRKYKKNRKSNSLESNETNETENSKDCEKKQEPKNNQQLQENCSENYNEEFEQAHSEKEEISKKVEEEHLMGKKEAKVEVNPQSQPIDTYESPKKSVSSSSTSTKFSKNSVCQQSQERELMREQLRAASISKLNEELQEISDRISEEANEYHDRRVIAFQRIQFLLQYYNVPIKLFGSCASGIAVRNSDIDIAVDNSILMYMDFLPENEKIRASLEKLEELFLTQPWITEIKFIKTAAIPLIKLTVDTRLPFFDPSIGEMYFELNRAHNCGPINADITIETKNKSEECSHLGLISTNTINRWIGEISSLHSIIIILKEFFGKKRLNCTYEGGLNTFSMIVLLVAFVFHARLEQEDNAAEVFYQFLRFYGEQFDEKERGVDLLNRDSSNIFYIKNLVNVEGVSAKLGKQGKQKADLEIKDPLNQQKNMTRNCYSFPQIKRLFRLLVENCFVRAENELEQLLSTRQEGKSALLQLNREAFAKRNVFIEFLNSVDLLF